MLKTLTAALLGTPYARKNHRRALRNFPTVKTGLARLGHIHAPLESPDDEAPIFLLSAGWRSGSTLLQRLIMSDPRILIWGEPYDECGLIQALANTLLAFRDDWPPENYFYDFYQGKPPGHLTGEWIANLFPSLEHWHKSHRALFDTLFSQPAKKTGASRWGIKEVRLGVEHCAYLKWLYPKASFVLLYRNPLDTYRSYCRYGRSWYDVFPQKPVFTPTAFGTHWRRLVEGFLRDAKALNALVIRYEDMVSDTSLIDKLEAYLKIEIDRRILESKVGSSEKNGNKAHVSLLERWLLKRAVGSVAEQVGYSW